MSITSQQYAGLAKHSYSPPTDEERRDGVLVEGVKYRALEYMDRPSGYQGTIYQREDTGDIVVAHRGTEFEGQPLQDLLLTDAGMVVTRINLQANDALELTRHAIQRAKDFGAKPGASTPEVTVTGHSLGGTHAQITAHHFNLRGETFNAFGAAQLGYYRIPEGGDRVLNHVMSADMVGNAGQHYGQVRMYARQDLIDRMETMGYENNRSPFDLRRPVSTAVTALGDGSHDMHNFLDVDGNGQPDVSVLRDPEARRLAQAFDPMIDKYQQDVQGLRAGLSIGTSITRTALGAFTPGGIVRDHAMARDVADAIRGDLRPGLPAQREADHRPPLPGHPLGERLRDNAHATPLPDHLLPGAASRSKPELPDYLWPAPTVRHSAPMPNTAPATTPAMHALPPFRSGSTHAPQHHYTLPPPAEPTVLPPLPTTQTLEPGDRGAAVQALQQHLQLLNARDAEGKEIQADRDYGDRTREAVEQFQLWTGREPTGIADPDTLQALQSQAQFALRQRGQGIVIAPEAHLVEHLAPTTPNRADVAIERPVQGRGQAGLTPFSDPQHPQHALYADVQQRFQAQGHDLSEAQLSVLAKQMHLDGYRPGWQGDVAVFDGQAMVGNLAQGFQEMNLKLDEPVPSVQETMQTFLADQQSLAEHMERMNKQQAQAHSHGLSR